MPHTRAKTIGALKAKSVADETKIRHLEAHKKWASNLQKADEKKIGLRDQRFRAYKKWTLAIQKTNFKRKREDKARIAKLVLDVSEGERACVELADVKKKMAEMAEELQTLKTQLGIITEV